MKKISFIALASVVAVSFSVAAFAGDHMRMKGMKAGHHMMHEMMDANGDGSVSTQEFQAFRGQNFSKADKNGDGNLDAVEFDALGNIMKEQRAQAMEMAKKKKAQKRFNKLDDNGDGKISRAEFDAKGERSFIRMDQNDDGQLDQADRHKKMHKMKKMDQ